MEKFANQYALIQPTHNRKDIKERKLISIKSLKYVFNKIEFTNYFTIFLQLIDVAIITHHINSL